MTDFFPFIDRSHSCNFRQIHRQIWPELIILISCLWKMDVLQIFGSWDQGTDSWFTNHEPLIPTLFSIFCFWIASYSAFNLRSSFLCSDSSSTLLIKNAKVWLPFPVFWFGFGESSSSLTRSLVSEKVSKTLLSHFFSLGFISIVDIFIFLPPRFFKNLLDIHGT